MTSLFLGGFVLAAILTTSSNAGLLGGLEPVDVRDPSLLAMVDEAMKTKMTGGDGPPTNYKIIHATRQVVRGIRYQVKIHVPKDEHVYSMVLHRDINNQPLKIVSFERIK